MAHSEVTTQMNALGKTAKFLRLRMIVQLVNNQSQLKLKIQYYLKLKLKLNHYRKD